MPSQIRGSGRVAKSDPWRRSVALGAGRPGTVLDAVLGVQVRACGRGRGRVGTRTSGTRSWDEDIVLDF